MLKAAEAEKHFTVGIADAKGVRGDFLVFACRHSARARKIQVHITAMLRTFAVRAKLDCLNRAWDTLAVWVCSFVTCKSHVVGEGRPSNPGGVLKVNVSQD